MTDLSRPPLSIPPLSIPRVIGHRGAATHAPENTIAGMHEAHARGARMVEVDVRLTADGRPVIFHDDGLDRTTNGAGPLDFALFDEVRNLDAGAWFGEQFAGERVPTLAEVIGVTGSLGLGLNLEIKSVPDRAVETAEIALTEAQRLWPEDRPPPLISSFQFEALKVAAKSAPDWPRGFLVGAYEGDWRQGAEEICASTINIDHAPQNEQSIADYAAYGKPVLCFTVNDAARAAHLFDWGVHAVFSDAPDAIQGPTK